MGRIKPERQVQKEELASLRRKVAKLTKKKLMELIRKKLAELQGAHKEETVAAAIRDYPEKTPKHKYKRLAYLLC